ncbi:hypothetical protein Tco_0816827 [Tanacetum coccineum]
MDKRSERKKHDLRTHNAQLHETVSVVGVAAVMVTIVAASAALSNNPTKEQRAQTKAAKAIACAAALAHSVVNFCCKFKGQQSFSKKQCNNRKK